MRSASSADAKDNKVKLSSKTKTKRSEASSLLGRNEDEDTDRIPRTLSNLWLQTLTVHRAVTIDVIAFP
jgi:hypothetical protein